MPSSLQAAIQTQGPVSRWTGKDRLQSVPGTNLCSYGSGCTDDICEVFQMAGRGLWDCSSDCAVHRVLLAQPWGLQAVQTCTHRKHRTSSRGN